METNSLYSQLWYYYLCQISKKKSIFQGRITILIITVVLTCIRPSSASNLNLDSAWENEVKEYIIKHRIEEIIEPILTSLVIGGIDGYHIIWLI